MKKFKKVVSVLFLVLVISLSMISTAFAKDIVLAMVSNNIVDPWHTMLCEIAKAECDKLGIKLNVYDPRNDQMLQLNIIDNLINMGVDGVAIVPVDGKGVVPGIEALNKAGIPVVAYDGLPNGGKLLASISWDNYAAGVYATEALIKGIKERYGGEVPEGKVILQVNISLARLPGQDRRRGFIKVLKDYPQLKVVEADSESNPDKAFSVTSDLMTKYGKDVIGIYGGAGVIANGIVNAVKSSGYDMKDIVFTSIGGFAEELDLIDQGLQYSAMCGPTTVVAELAMRFLYYAANDMLDKLPKIGETYDVPGVLGIPVKVTEYLGGPAIRLAAGKACPQDVPTDEPTILGNLY